MERINFFLLCSIVCMLIGIEIMLIGIYGLLAFQ